MSMNASLNSTWGRVLRNLICIALLSLAGAGEGQARYEFPGNFGRDVELWAVVGEAFDDSIATGLAPSPQIVDWDPLNPALPAGLSFSSFEVTPGLDWHRGVRIQGTPTVPGIYYYTLQYNTYRVSGPGTLTLVIFPSAEERDATAYYTSVMQSSGTDYY